MGMCFNKKVIAALAAVGVGVWLFAPNALAAALPLLLLAACPLSMILMMRMMPGMTAKADPVAEGLTQDGSTDELAALRAEVQHLQAENARREAGAG